MKNLKIIFIVLISMATITGAQIPNYGFEFWEIYSDPDNNNNEYQKPDQWLGLLPNSPLTYSFSIEKNMDSYPPGTGEYSMIIKSDTPNGVDGVAFSYDSYPPGLSPEYFPPAFPINYRPASLFLYYKYLPENGDSMHIVGSFYKNRVVVGEFEYCSPQIVSDWSLLEIPISYNNSETPDSATIILTTFCNTQHNGSKLYVDNLNFDTPITAIDENTGDELPKNFALMQNYPNPFNPSTIIEYSIPQTAFVTIKVYNLLGKEAAVLLKEKQSQGNYKIEFNAGNLPSGIYYYQLKISNEVSETKKMVLLR